MGYSSDRPDMQRSIGRAKARALSELQKAHEDEYNEYYEDAMWAEGYVRCRPGGRGHRERGGWAPIDKESKEWLNRISRPRPGRATTQQRRAKMTSRRYKVTETDGGLAVTDADTGELCDWIAGPSAGNEGDTNEYVVVPEHPEAWPEDMRWMVTPGQRVRQTYGLNEGRIGTIVAQARSRKADRIYAENLRNAQSAGRELTDSDFEILIDNEGALVQFDGETGVEWFPGQSFGFVPIG